MPPFVSARRPVRIANCSGASTDQGIHMYNQATYGPVDVITGDYLAEGTLGNDALRKTDQSHPGWVPTALAGIEMSLDVVNEKRIKIVVNGGSLNPTGLAEKVHGMLGLELMERLWQIAERGLQLRVAFVDGDDLMPKVHSLLRHGSAPSSAALHLDNGNQNVKLAKDTLTFLDNPATMPILSANAYLGYRAIQRGLDLGADIVICGRVADASPVIAAAAWWYGWAESDFDALAGALVAGHLIECSTYVTGANFAGAYKYPPSAFVDLGLPIAEVAANGECVVTKHEALGGFVTADTVKCQLLYELQGNIYLNSDVKADLTGVKVVYQAQNRVHVSGVKGHPPPPTTKLAVFYRGGYQLEILINATGYGTDHKWDVQEAQIRNKLKEWGTLDDIDVLEFQRVGVSEENPDSQLASTTYMRVFAQARDRHAVTTVTGAWNFCFMAHFPGMNCSFDYRTIFPRPFLGYFPAVISQGELDEAVTILDSQSAGPQRRFTVGPPKITEPVADRDNYETANPSSLDSFGPRTMRPLGDVVLGRSGDKAGNVNIGLFVESAEQYDWLRSFLTREKVKELMRKDWRDWYFIERVEMPNIFAVHFVVYGLLGRGVSSSSRLDSLGKGFAEFIRAVWVPVPAKFLQEEPAKL
ncbi:acyclic terpene utilization family protein [Hirsutella rhossiliensis]|uniref:Acyclic terpene utilization family protein atuA domain-containing protein n=1 Tax=Hirsutella rhossiliensis TaxID=111463 RepID=A0A9P8N7W4_9HYPO|nr:acyclic terpene utilization family protein atuA domain-containing protein [Hirsutella rhossiliensis]KAH0967364.1 acyclic terpene utilization family protein atuA domain-containing protein [Hirsutella rhossiliensis]